MHRNYCSSCSFFICFDDQLSQAISYLAETMNKDGKLKLKLKTSQMYSKVLFHHISCMTYRCFLRNRPNSVGVSGLTHSTCECSINGKRTVGCYSHIAPIVYYLYHARYLSKIFQPAHTGLESLIFGQNLK